MIFFVNPSIFVFHLKDSKSKSRTTDNEGINEKKSEDFGPMWQTSVVSENLGV